MKTVRELLVLFTLAFWGCISVCLAKDSITFERDVRPIFKAYCLDCHGGGDVLKGRLDLRLKRFAERGGDSGPAIVAGKPEESYLLDRLHDAEMPPGEKKVPREKIELISRWIAAGATTLRPEPKRLPPGVDITPEERAYWAFQPIKRPDPPLFRGDDHCRTPIDAFVLAPLRKHGFSLADEADKRTLIRRAAFDLTGLPPTQDELDFFLADTRHDAYERLIDRLLESPHYGERWARHWLDAAGYADSDGNGSEDTERPFAYKYRDYVVRSLNIDKPLDRFLIEQLAGDELVPPPWNNLTAAQAETLAATGFLRMAADGTSSSGGDLALVSNQVVADTLKIVGSTLMGLSIGCAECHDHRYDPIPRPTITVSGPSSSRRLIRTTGGGHRSVWSRSTTTRTGPRPPPSRPKRRQLQKQVDAKTEKYVAAALKKELGKFPEPLRTRLRVARATSGDKRTAEQKALLATHPSLNLNAGVLYQYNQAAADELKKDQEHVAARRAGKPVEDFVSVLSEQPGIRPETHVFHRGDHRQPKQVVRPGDLTIAATDGERFEIRDTAPAHRRRAAGWPSPGTSPAGVIRFWAECWSTGSGFITSGVDWSTLPATSAPWAAVPRIPSCSTGWPTSLFERLEPETPAPADHDRERSIANRPGAIRPRTPSTATTLSWAAIRCGGWMRRRSGTRFSGRAGGLMPRFTVRLCRSW